MNIDELRSKLLVEQKNGYQSLTAQQREEM